MVSVGFYIESAVFLGIYKESVVFFRPFHSVSGVLGPLYGVREGHPEDDPGHQRPAEALVPLAQGGARQRYTSGCTMLAAQF